MWLLWLVVGIAFGIAEIAYSGFFLIWFAIGSIAALLTSFLTDSTLIQLIVFVVVSTVLLLTLTKRFAKRFAKHDTTPTNIDALIGKQALVTQAINTSPGETGLVKLDGEIWTACAVEQDLIPNGTSVVIREVRGVRLIVSKL
ncbi:MAG: NfeD family protein [Cellulosilyticaceae bacterium]